MTLTPNLTKRIANKRPRPPPPPVMTAISSLRSFSGCPNSV